jgi:tetratricopeptide (TPR) repeat protein
MHKQGQEIYKTLRQEAPRYEWVFDLGEKCLQALREKYWSAQLREVNQQVVGFQDRTLSLQDYLQVVEDYVQKGVVQWQDCYPTINEGEASFLQLLLAVNEFPPVDNASVNKEFRNLATRLTKLFASNQQINFDQIRPSAINMLVQSGITRHEAIEKVDRLPMQEKVQLFLKFKNQMTQLLLLAMASLNQHPGDFENIADKVKELKVFSGIDLSESDDEQVFDLIIDLSTFCGIDLQEYPNFLNGSHVLHHKNAIERKRFYMVSDVQFIEKTLKEKLADTAESQMTLRIQYHLTDMKELLNLQLSAKPPPEVYTASYKIHRRDLTLKNFLAYGLVKDHCPKAGLKRLQETQAKFDILLTRANEYYRIGERRSRHIVNNTFAHMREKGITSAILIITGYLEPYVTDELKSQSVSYISINSKVSADYTIDDYFNALDSGLPGANFTPTLTTSHPFLSLPEIDATAQVLGHMETNVQQENWQAAIQRGQEFCFGRPLITDWAGHIRATDNPIKNPHTIILLYLALAYLRSGLLTQAEFVANVAQDHLKPEQEGIKKQLELLQEQIAHAQLYTAIQSIQEAIKQQAWSTVIKLGEGYCFEERSQKPQEMFVARHIWEVPSLPPLKRPDPSVLFYLAIAYAREDRLDEARQVVNMALEYCPPEETELKKQLSNLRQQIKSAQAAPTIRKIEEAIEKGDWQQVIEFGGDYCFVHQQPNPTVLPQSFSFIDPLKASVINPDPIILYYMAVAYARLNRLELAKHVAQEALSCCQPEQRQLQVQISNLLSQFTTQTLTQDLNPSVELMNNHKWLAAMAELEKIIKQEPTNAYALYYQTLCKQQIMIEVINNLQEGLDSKSRQSFTDYCDDLLNTLGQAARHCPSADEKLKSQIRDLQSNIESIQAQLRGW